MSEKKEYLADVVLQITGKDVPGKRYRTYLGQAAIDSGQLSIVDPCYLDVKNFHHVDDFYKKFMVVVNSDGDGIFKIYREETIYQAGNESVGFFEHAVNKKIVIEL